MCHAGSSKNIHIDEQRKPRADLNPELSEEWKRRPTEKRWNMIKDWMTKSSLYTAVRLPLHPDLGGLNTEYPPSDQHMLPIKYSDLDNGDIAHCAIAFVHGGLPRNPNHPQLQSFPTTINGISNALFEKYTQSSMTDVGLLTKDKQPLTLSEDEYIFLAGKNRRNRRAYSPLWYRRWFPDNLNDVKNLCDDAEHILKKVGVQMLVMGHTPTVYDDVCICYPVTIPQTVC